MKETQKAESLTAGEGLRRPPRLPEVSDLERMARLGRSLSVGLKSERVELLLLELVHWELTLKGRGITRMKELPSPAAAALYSGFVTGLASEANMPAFLNVSGNRVLVTLHAPRVQGRIPLLTEDVFGLARQLG